MLRTQNLVLRRDQISVNFLSLGITPLVQQRRGQVIAGLQSKPVLRTELASRRARHFALDFFFFIEPTLSLHNHAKNIHRFQAQRILRAKSAALNFQSRTLQLLRFPELSFTVQNPPQASLGLNRLSIFRPLQFKTSLQDALRQFLRASVQAKVHVCARHGVL